MGSIEEQIERKGLELGFSNVGFAAVRDYPEYLGRRAAVRTAASSPTPTTRCSCGSARRGR